MKAGIQAIGHDVIIRDVGSRGDCRAADQGARRASLRVFAEKTFEYDSPEDRRAMVQARADELVVRVPALVRLGTVAPHHMADRVHREIAAALLGAAA